MFKTHLFLYPKNMTMTYYNRPALSCFNRVISKKMTQKNNINKKRKEKIDELK